MFCGGLGAVAAGQGAATRSQPVQGGAAAARPTARSPAGAPHPNQQPSNSTPAGCCAHTGAARALSTHTACRQKANEPPSTPRPLTCWKQGVPRGGGYMYDKVVARGAGARGELPGATPDPAPASPHLVLLLHRRRQPPLKHAGSWRTGTGELCMRQERVLQAPYTPPSARAISKPQSPLLWLHSTRRRVLTHAPRSLAASAHPPQLPRPAPCLPLYRQRQTCSTVHKGHTRLHITRLFLTLPPPRTSTHRSPIQQTHHTHAFVCASAQTQGPNLQSLVSSSTS